MNPITVLIVADRLVIRQGLCSILDTEDRIEVTGEASTGLEAIKWMREYSADIVLMDIQMPVVDGIDATAVIMKSRPESKILMLTMTDDPSMLAKSIRAGAKGYLVYSLFAPEELINAIYTVAAGGSWPLSPAVELALADLNKRNLSPERQQLVATLTPEEAEILNLISDGRSNVEISRILEVEEVTIRNHISQLYSKIGIENRYEAIHYRLKLAA